MQLNSYLIFKGQAEAAFNFYAKCLGGKVVMLMRFKDSPGGEEMPAEYREQIMHVRLEVGDQALMASDNHPSMPYDGIKGCSISIGIDDISEAERLFDALKQGGKVQMALEKTFWAERFGMLVDQFGVAWMINCEKDRHAAA
jgi:PhnB protein